jgi:hypothetical protein
MNLTQIKQVKKFCESLHSKPCWKEVIENIENFCPDFTISEVRFICDTKIQDILEDEISSDTYTLGCFIASAIAEATDWPEFLIKAAQEGEQYEAIGEAMTGEHVANLASIYVSMDGYGHHFNRWDFSAEELTIGDKFYHVFDNH